MGSAITQRLSALGSWWRRQQLPIRLGVIGGAGASLAVAVLLAVIFTGGGAIAESPEDPPIVVAPSTPTPTPTPTETPTPSPSPEPTRTPPPQREPVASMAHALTQFIDAFGYPDAADFARLRIPVLGVDVAVSSKTVGFGSAMPDPVGPAHVVWYDLDEYQGMGGIPGQGGNAIFSGHVDYNAYVPYTGINYRGRGVFYDLDLLEEGDVIEIDYQGETLRYYVTWKRHLSANSAETNWASIWRSTRNVDEITIYTCGGDFDPITKTYADRIVVRAERI
jgi:hypothetical protein